MITINETNTNETNTKSNPTIQDWVNDVGEYAASHGWNDTKRTFGDWIALFHSELSEALEEYRNGRLQNEIYFSDSNGVTNLYYIKGQFEKPEGIPIELADCVIRIMHFFSLYNIDLEDAIATKMGYNEKRPYRHGNKKL